MLRANPASTDAAGTDGLRPGADVSRDSVSRRGTGRERGQSFSVLAAVIMVALIITAGLVIDGGQKADAVGRAESVAAAAARVGSEAGATQAIAGQPDATVAVAAAQNYLASSPDVRGSASMVGGRVHVHAEVSSKTVLLSLIGIDQVSGSADAEAELVGSG